MNKFLVRDLTFIYHPYTPRDCSSVYVESDSLPQSVNDAASASHRQPVLLLSIDIVQHGVSYKS